MFNNKSLENWSALGLMRKRHTVAARSTSCIEMANKKMVNFSSNDYLGLSMHSEIVNHLSQAVKEYGFGSGASSVVSGYCQSHEKFEKEMAQWLGVERTILMGSGTVRISV